MIARPRPARRPGLSLIEVLLALVIFLLSLVAIGGLVDFGSQRGEAAAMTAAGTRLAQAKMAEVEAGSVSVSTSSQGTFDYEPDWNWSVEPGSSTVPNVYPVTVRVWRDVSGRHYEISLTEMVFDPTQMGTAAAAQSQSSQTTTGTQTQQGTGSGSGSSGGTGP